MLWLEEILDKLERKHRVQGTEVLDNRPRFRFVERGHHEGVYVALGRTDAGRFLAVFFVFKRDGRALVVSARDMTSAEKRLYEQK